MKLRHLRLGAYGFLEPVSNEQFGNRTILIASRQSDKSKNGRPICFGFGVLRKPAAIANDTVRQKTRQQLMLMPKASI